MQPPAKVAKRDLLLAAVAAFSTYFCMYAFRKPFTAATFEDQEVFGAALKSTLVISQLLGYMISKFIGIRVVSGLPRKYRALAILCLIGIAELALVGFAFLPQEPWIVFNVQIPLKVVMLFFNGLPLGMVFGLVLSYLEGRKQTEALSAALCASFIISSGVVKSVGQGLIQRWGVSEFSMPMVTGLIFILPLLVSVWLLQRTPPPSKEDIKLRTERKEMSFADQWKFFTSYWPGLIMLLAVYIILTVIRTIRDDFGVELWADLGVAEEPTVFAQSETIVAIIVTALNAVAILFRNNLYAIRAVVILMCISFLMAMISSFLQTSSLLSPLGFMILCGIGLYVPYVAFHTTIFERIVSSSSLAGNLIFLMYLADAFGYLGYSLSLAILNTWTTRTELLPTFLSTLTIGSGASIACLIFAVIYFQRKLSNEDPTRSNNSNP